MTDIARSMVMRYGMHDKLGHVAYDMERPTFLAVPGEAMRGREFSEETAREIDRAVRAFVEAAFDKALAILNAHRDVLERGARALLEKETLVEEDLAALRSTLPAAA